MHLYDVYMPLQMLCNLRCFCTFKCTSRRSSCICVAAESNFPLFEICSDNDVPEDEDSEEEYFNRNSFCKVLLVLNMRTCAARL